jgi:hypothetical protein
MLKLISNRCSHEITGSGGSISAYGKQGASECLGYLNGTNLTSVLTDYRNSLAATTTTPNLITGERSFKILVTNVTATIYITNQGAGSIELDLYDCMKKVTGAVYSNTTTAWNDGLTDQSGNIGTAMINTFPFTKPTVSKLFNMEWKIKKMQRIELGPGRTHKHTFVFTPNFLFDTEYLTKYNQIKGFTFATMVAHRGLPVDDNILQNPAAVGVISLCDSKIIYVTNYKTTFSTLQANPRSSRFSNNLLLVKPANAYDMQEESGIRINVGTSGTSEFA